MPVLGQMLLEQHPHFTVSSCDISSLSATITREEVGRHLQNVEAADVVVSQPVSEYRGEPELSVQTLRAALPARSTLITLPSVVFEGTHGAFTYFGGRLDGLHMPYHNNHTVEMALRGYDWRDVTVLQSAPEFYSEEFVTSGIEASLSTLRAREAAHGTTLTVSPLLDECCRTSVVMHAINHPVRALMARLLNLLYGALSLPRTARESGTDHLINPHIPPLPTVLHHLGIRDDDPMVRSNGRSWTREQYLRESLAFYGRLIRSDLVRAFAGSRGAEFLAAFHRGQGFEPAVGDGPVSGLPPDTVAAIVVDGFGALLGRPPAPEDIAPHGDMVRSLGVRRWLEILLASPEFTGRFGSQAPG